MYASDSSSALSEDVEVWHAAQTVHEGNGVRIELAIRGDLESIKIFDSPEMENRFVQMLSCRLALKLKSSMSFPVASKCIKEALELYEKKVKRIKEEAFFNDLKKTYKFIESRPVSHMRIEEMLLTVALAQSAVKIKVEGSAKLKECQTFFPPYTFVSEGAIEIKSDETPHVFSANFVASSPMSTPLMGVFE